MKFLVSKELRDNPLLKNLVLFISVILIGFLITDILLHHFQIGLWLDRASESILGNEEAFIDPMPFDTMLERVHVDILTSMLTLLIISSVCISVAKNNRFKGVLIHTAFISAILSHCAFLSSLYLGNFTILIWIVLFLLWHILAILMSISIIWRLFYK